MNNSSLSHNLKYFRKQKGLSQQEIADKLNMNRTTYASYEAGRNEPSITILAKFCEFLT